MSTTWHDLTSARAQWFDAPALDEQLADLLEVAREQVIEYAPVLAEAAPIPTGYRVAQLMQARNIWNASKVSPSGDIGDGSYIITPKPLDWMVRQLLRPRKIKPGMF